MITNDILQLLATGATVRISASGRATSDLIRMAACACGSKAHLILDHVGHKPVKDLLAIAAEGQGCVAFDLNE